MKKLFLILLLFSTFVFADTADDMQANCLQLAPGDKMSLGNCVNEQMKNQTIFNIGAKVIEKQGWDMAAGVFSPIADINTDGIEDNADKNGIIFGVAKYIGIEALKWFCVFIMVFFGWGLYNQARTGTILSLQNLYMFLWIFGGGGALIYFFWKFVSFIAACGVLIVLFFLAFVVPIIAGLQAKDVKPLNNEFMVASKAKAEEIVDDLNRVFVTDFRNRKVILFNNSNESDVGGLRLEDREFVDCLRSDNVTDAGDSAMYTPNTLLNTSYCVTKVYGYAEYYVGHVADSLASDESIEIVSQIKALADKERTSYSYLVERNNCARAFNANGDKNKNSFSSCMDMDADGTVKFGKSSYLKMVTDPVMSNDSLKVIRASLVSELSVSIYTASLKAASKIEPAKLSSGVGGLWDMVSANQEYKSNYRAAGNEVINAVTVNTDVNVRKTFIQSSIEVFKSTVVNSDEGINNDFGLLDYAQSLSADAQPINLFNTVNLVTGGGASLTGFNYEDCLNKTNCAIASLDLAGRLTDATKSVVGPAFTGYLILTVASSVGKSENNKIVGTNKSVGNIEKPAKMGAGIFYAIAIILGFFYLKFFYELFGKPLFRMLDWLFMVVIMSFTMFFAVFGMGITLIKDKRIDMNYFDFIRASGIHDIAFRPLLMGISWVGTLVVMYIMFGISSILTYNHLQEYVSTYSTGSDAADYAMQGVFNFLYAFIMIFTAGKTLSEVDKVFAHESDALFSGMHNSLEAVDSVFDKIKGLSSAHK